VEIQPAREQVPFADGDMRQHAARAGTARVDLSAADLPGKIALARPVTRSRGVLPPKPSESFRYT
jgi:hypothetical protein